jgi:hypothetical protein
MQIKRLLAGMLIAGSTTLGLTACDPPMPPDVAAQLAEEYYTCVEGESTVSSDLLMSDVVLGWADSLSFSCIDPEPTMTLTVLDQSDTSVAAQISASQATCSPLETFPIGVDASVLVFTQSELGAISLSPKSIAGILDGSITNWNELGEDNPGYEMPDMPIQLIPEADKVALDAMRSFLAQSDITLSDELLVEGVVSPEVDLYSALPEGYFALVPNSYASYLGLTPASIYLGFNEEFQESIVANADLPGIQSATTQWKYSESESGLTVTLDPNTEPTPPEGSDTIDNPYQAIYPVNFNMCSSDELITRAIGRFMLRLDSQGALGGSYFVPLPEAIRIAALVRVSKGLPTPAPTE